MKNRFDDMEPDLSLELITHVRDDIDRLEEHCDSKTRDIPTTEDNLNDTYSYGQELFRKYVSKHPDFYQKSDTLFNHPMFYDD